MADELHVITGLEAVRRRPGMYIGGTDSVGLHNLLWECVGNVVDLHLARHATEARLGDAEAMKCAESTRR